MPGMLQPKREIKWLNHEMAMVKVWPITGKPPREKLLYMTKEQYDRWQAGDYIQRAMAHLSATDREFLMSGMLDEEFKRMVAD
jgi:hypothetical protein